VFRHPLFLHRIAVGSMTNESGRLVDAPA